ncbi:14 kDa subunit of cytochrome bd ubiquinol oxidase [Ramaria rubella]|nr:14 kDa subunit of cytochrome bd ubiquinol oxidase [Ramaria rubella]
MVGGPLGISLAPYIKQSRYWSRILTPFAKWYAGAAGYRRMGLKYDDLLLEERPDVQKALSRLPPREAYDRIHRLLVASQCSVLHKDLPKEQWVKASEDVRYLKPYVAEVAREDEERRVWDTIVVEKKHH